jgi:hypothetical protein
MREFVLLGLRAEAKRVDVVDDLAQVVAAGDFVFDLAEDFPDFVFDGVRSGGLLREAVQVGEEFPIDEVAEVVAGRRPVVVDLAVPALGRGPFLPAVGLVEDVGVLLAFERGFVGPVLLQRVQVFQEQEPRGLFRVVQFGGAASLFPEDVVDVFEGLFKHVRKPILVGNRGRVGLSRRTAHRSAIPAPGAVCMVCLPGHPVHAGTHSRWFNLGSARMDLPAFFWAMRRSYRLCRLSQNSALVPKK